MATAQAMMTRFERMRSEEHTSELQSPCNLVCRLIISEEHTSELQSPCNLVCRLLLEKKKNTTQELLCSNDGRPHLDQATPASSLQLAVTQMRQTTSK